MKHRGADTVERETQEMVARAISCLGDEFNTSSGEENPPPSRPPGRDGFDTGGLPDRLPPAPQQPQQTPRRPQPAPQRPTPSQQPPQQTTRRPPLTSQAERVERICDLQRLAQWIFRRYKTGRPIARVRVVNAVQPERSAGLDLYRVPQVSTLKTPCYEIDLTTLQEFQARNLFDLYLGAANQRTSASPPLNPTRNLLPDHLRVNCFWVALAQDRLWATGLPIPARCEARPISREDIPHVLARWHGHKRIDDGHGTQREAFERHWNGEPVGTTREGIEHALKARGSRAIIFTRDQDNPDVGHVFNARRGENGEMEYFDGQDNLDASWRFAPRYDFWMYQTQQ